MFELEIAAILVIVLVIFILIVLAKSLTTVLEYQRLVIFSASGKFIGVRGPGLILIRPWERAHPYRKDHKTGKIVERAFDLREKSYDVGQQGCITKDNVPVNITPIVFFKIIDPAKTVLTIEDAELAILNLAKTTLRAVIGDMGLAEVIARREYIAEQLEMRLDKESERWGVDVTTVDIADLTLTPEVASAMSERKATIEKAEGERRSKITKAEAEKEASLSEKEAQITRAEAGKQSLIITSEAQKQSAIMIAEGQKVAKILESEGLESYYKKLADLGKSAEIVLRFENTAAVKRFADSQNEKLVIIPLDSTQAFNFTELKSLQDMLPSKGKKPE